MLVLIFLMPTLRGKSQKVSIDYIGATLLVLGTVPLLLGFTWAGTQYAWNSPQIIGIFAGSIAVLTGFVVYEALLERRGGQPIIEPSLFKNRIFTVSALVTAIFGMGLFGSIFFIPLFVQGVQGSSATNSGLILTPLMLTSIVGSVVSGQLVSRLGKYKWLAILGMIISVAGTLMLVRLSVTSGNTDVLLAMLVLGLGMGFGMSLYERPPWQDWSVNGGAHLLPLDWRHNCAGGDGFNHELCLPASLPGRVAEFYQASSGVESECETIPGHLY
jgi:Na+/melibiose symporter-like transporter